MTTITTITPITTEQNTPAQILSRAWQRRGPLACLLWPLSLVFWLLQALRSALYKAGALRSVSLPVPVIVIGNIFVGGTGKTPLLIWLLAQLREQGFTPGVISRGYGRHAEQVLAVTALMSPQQVGDEPLLIAQKTAAPMMVGRNRVAAGLALCAAFPEVDVIISDDGLQHYALARTVEIQLSDARGHGNGWLLPAGPLRERPSRRSDFYVVNGAAETGEHAFRMQLTGTHAEQLTDRSRQRPLSALLSQQGIAAVAGIGHPQRFFDMLRAQGVVLSEQRALPDHFDFSVNPFAAIAADIILITEKDAVKCEAIDMIARDSRLWVVPVQTTITGSLVKNIVEKLRGHSPA